MGARLKRSPWLPGEEKPARKGVYQRDINGSIIFSRWDGTWWRVGGPTVKAADKMRLAKSSMQCQSWRGLAEKAV